MFHPTARKGHILQYVIGPLPEDKRHTCVAAKLSFFDLLVVLDLKASTIRVGEKAGLVLRELDSPCLLSTF